MRALFEPFVHGSLRLRNRIVMAPMTRGQSPGGIPDERVARYYRRRAEGEVGLIVTEGTGIRRSGSLNTVDAPVLYDEAVPAWARVVDGVHAANGMIAAQLWHVGARPHELTSEDPFGKPDSPSGMPWPGRTVGEPMSERDIAATIEAYAEAAGNAVQAGFDAVEIHGAHGYLLDQFFWDATNLRTDRWGGSTLAQRASFAVAVIRAVRAAIGDATTLMLRVSQDKSPDGSIRLANDPQEMASWLQPLVEAGVDILHCSTLRLCKPEFSGSDLSFAGWARKLTGVPVIAVGSVGLSLPNGAASYTAPVAPAPIDEVERRLADGEFDLVAVGRSLISDPEWPRKLRGGRVEELRGFNPADMATLD